MGYAFEKRVDDVDQSKHAENGKEGAVISVKVFLVIDELLERARGWETKKRSEIQDRGRDQNEAEQKKRPWLRLAPAMKNPPPDHSIAKKMHHPHRVQP